jgi:hypothetical protein
LAERNGHIPEHAQVVFANGRDFHQVGKLELLDVAVVVLADEASALFATDGDGV